MVSRRVLANLVTFFVVSFALVAYGALTLLGNPLAERRSVSAVFPDASGVLTGFSASLNGVVVGTVSSVELEGDAARVTVSLDPGRELPGDVEASIVRASAVGEQRIEFTPQRGGDEPPLPDGAEVPVAVDGEPPQISRVIDTVNGLLEAVPPDALDVVVHETATALRGREEDLRALTRDLDVANREFLEHERGFRRLLITSPPLLDAVTEVAPELRRAFADTAELTELLADRRLDLVELQRHGADFADEGTSLLADESAGLACLARSFAELSEAAGAPGPLGDLEAALEHNQDFFGPVERLAVRGDAIGFPEYGSVDRSDQGWLRVQTLVPPGEPPASRYQGIRATPPIRPGDGCVNAFGTGAPAASQLDPPTPARRGGYDDPAVETIELGPIAGSTADATTDRDPAAGGTGDTPRADDTEAARSGVVEGRPAPLAAAAPIRSGRDSAPGGVSWRTVGAGLVLAVAALGTVKGAGALRRRWSR
ncbi:MAG: MCE family protein [Acidimicrobiales bacterium]|nr:MCE family protein [Acidimicrobiales bacterium]